MEEYNYVRMSIDTYIFEHHGTYGRDYPTNKYEDFQDEAETALKSQLGAILRVGIRDVVLDYSFYSKDTRDEYRDMIHEYGGGLYDGKT